MNMLKCYEMNQINKKLIQQKMFLQTINRIFYNLNVCLYGNALFFQYLQFMFENLLKQNPIKYVSFCAGVNSRENYDGFAVFFFSSPMRQAFITLYFFYAAIIFYHPKCVSNCVIERMPHYFIIVKLFPIPKYHTS